jgi:hypothetical protein
MIAIFILGNSITHAYTYVIVVLYVPVARHGHLPSRLKHIESMHDIIPHTTSYVLGSCA